LWAATPGPFRRSGGSAFSCRHAAGATTFTGETDDIRHELRVFVSADDPVKLSVLTLENPRPRPGGSARSRITSSSWAPEGWRAASRRVVVLGGLARIFATNPYSGPFASRVAFVAASGEVLSATGDRAEFLGRNGSVAGRPRCGGADSRGDSAPASTRVRPSS